MERYCMYAQMRDRKPQELKSSSVPVSASAPQDASATDLDLLSDISKGGTPVPALIITSLKFVHSTQS